MLEHSLEIVEVLRVEEGGDGDLFRKRRRFLKVYLVYLVMSLSWQQIQESLANAR